MAPPEREGRVGEKKVSTSTPTNYFRVEISVVKSPRKRSQDFERNICKEVGSIRSQERVSKWEQSFLPRGLVAIWGWSQRKSGERSQGGIHKKAALPREKVTEKKMERPGF